MSRVLGSEDTEDAEVTASVAKRENVPPTTDTPKNCLPFYRNQTPIHKLIIASYRAVPRYPLFATLSSLLNSFICREKHEDEQAEEEGWKRSGSMS